MNCKPGDLAYVVADEHAENVGRIVEVLGTARFVFHAPAWYCAVWAAPIRIVDPLAPTRACYGYRADFADADLKPVFAESLEPDDFDCAPS